MSLATYRKKRDFRFTPEPRGSRQPTRGRPSYLIQKHAARRLHYDFRLEHRGALLSWAVPEGPPLAPGERRLAVRIEDHPLEYGTFEGVIPQGQYGGGTVMLWDRGHWVPGGDTSRGLREGKLTFELAGERLRGRWTLARMGGEAGEGGKNWLLIKRSDERGRTTARFDGERSVATARTMAEIAGDADRTRSSTEGELDTGVRKKRQRAPSSGPIPGAVKRAMPAALKPQLATLESRAPTGDGWLHEFKYDGYRILAFCNGRSVRLRTRTGRDWTANFASIARAVAQLELRRAILDGEVVVLDGERSDFQALQNSLEGGARARHSFVVFDLPYYDGYDLTACRLIDRKELLAGLLPDDASRGVVRYSRHVVGHGAEFFGQSCRHALEGVISKRVDAPYVSVRSRTWLKTKCIQRQEFVVGGWSDPEGHRVHFGSLLLGAHDARRRFVYCGRVGTGFSGTSLSSLAKRLQKLATASSPFAAPLPRSETRDVHWVKPDVVVEVAFREWTRGGHLRQPSFQGVRDDKPARDVRLERARDGAAAAPRASPRPAIRLTHPERVLYPEDGITKRELVDYYAAVAEWMLPHVAGRPLTLVRCPEGLGRPCFYQKHAKASLPRSVRAVDVPKEGGVEHYVAIDDLDGLLALVQSSVLEFHPWGSRADAIDRPDRIVFDLDPHPDVAWDLVVKTAHAMRELLQRLELQSFARTTGGKGLHVVVPIERRASWPRVKQFSKSVVATVAERVPELYVLTATKSKRTGRIFLDYLRNDRGSTAIAPYSTRARAGAPVATPIAWDELTSDLDPRAFDVRSVPQRLRALQRDDPWAEFFELRQRLPAAGASSARRRKSALKR